jgi:hypothetical protein
VDLIIGGLLPDEPNASAVRTALKGFAFGRFASRMAVKYFFETFLKFQQMHNGQVRLTFECASLTRSLYAGCFNVSKWNIRLPLGKVSFETRQMVQATECKPSSVIQMETNEDFSW